MANSNLLINLIKSHTSKRFLIAILLVAIVPLGIFNVIANDNLQASTYASANERLSNEAGILKTHFNNQLDSYQNDIITLMNINMIQDLINYRENDLTTTTYVNSLSNTDKINGSIYPVLYKNNSQYTNLLTYFEKTISNRPDIDLIRIFYKDGNVLCGVSQSGEDQVDYKGDKSWFNDIIVKKQLNIGDVYISPLSIARQTNTPAIRYITPYDVNGTRAALLIINFKASVITDVIKDFKLGTTGFGMLIDLNYENAEGNLLGPMFISNKLQPTLEFNESSANNIQFNASDFPSDNGLINFIMNNVHYKGSYAKIVRDSRTYVIMLGWGLNEINLPVRTFNNQSIFIFFVLIIFGIIASALVTFILVKPLYDITETAEKIKEGDYSARVEKKYKGEIGILASSFNEVTELITEKIYKASIKVKTSAEQLASSINEMASSAEEINASSEEITSIAQNMASGSQKQTEQLTRTVRETDDLKQTFSMKINEIKVTSQIIESITSQVNMLALNASIEAARAGEYGRGFSVVADNIRKLADETKSSLDKVNDIFNDLGSSLKKSIDSLGENIESVLAIAEETASSSQEASAATEEQSATIQEMTASAQELSHLAIELNDLTDMLTN